jgi:hypothetical protein
MHLTPPCSNIKVGKNSTISGKWNHIPIYHLQHCNYYPIVLLGVFKILQNYSVSIVLFNTQTSTYDIALSQEGNRLLLGHKIILHNYIIDNMQHHRNAAYASLMQGMRRGVSQLKDLNHSIISS